MERKFSIRKIIGTYRFKTFLVSIFAIAVILSFTKALSEFNTTDVDSPLQDIDIEATRKFAAFTVHVETGLFIRNFPYFNMIENKFVVDMVLWFRFDPTEITLDTIDKFSFENGKILEKSPPDVKIIDDKTFVKYDIVAEVKSNLEYHRFPLEDHRMCITLTNNFVTPYEVIFDVLSTDFVVAPNIFVANWTVKKLDTNFGIDENILNQIDKTKKIAYPKAAFIIDFAKAGIRKVFIIFGPIFIIFFLALFSFFAVISDTFGRATLSVSALTALLGYRFVIEGMMPKVGYFTTTDHVYMILLGFALFNAIFQITLSRLYFMATAKKTGAKEKNETYSFMRDVIFIFFVIAATTLLSVAIL